jgi:nicotinamidase/pyrazinamidase
MKNELQNSALLFVDIQNDFCPGGALGVNEGDQIIPVVNSLIKMFPFVVATQDWHPPDHISFKERGGPWPPHCVQGTKGAEFHPDLDTKEIDLQLRKAFTRDKDAYSSFEAVDDAGRSLDEVLKSKDIHDLYVVGLATDYCVLASTIDGLKNGYNVYVVTDAVRAVNVNSEDGQKALEQMAASGAHLITSNQIRGESESAARR